MRLSQKAKPKTSYPEHNVGLISNYVEYLRQMVRNAAGGKTNKINKSDHFDGSSMH